MVRPSGNKAAHVTCICSALGGPHNFDMQSSGGLADGFAPVAVNGLLMSFLDALRSLAEQVAVGGGLIIDASVLSYKIALMVGRFAVRRDGALCTITIR